MKKTLTRIGIILIALAGIVGGLYQLYEIYVLGQNSANIKFSSFSDPLVSGTIISIFTILVSIGLWLHNKIARWIIVFSNYLGLMFTLMMLVILLYLGFYNPEKSGGISAPMVFMSLASALIFVLMIYLLTNQEALTLFNIQRKSSRKEIVLFSVFALLMSVLPLVLTGLISQLIFEDVSFEKLEPTQNLNQDMQGMLKDTQQQAADMWSIKSNSTNTPLEILGRNIYMREACFKCHSRESRYESYGLQDEQKTEETFQWGNATRVSLAGLGGKYSNAHLLTQLTDPTRLKEASKQPAYPWLLEQTLNVSGIENMLKSLASFSSDSTEKETNQNQAAHAQQNIQQQHQKNNYDGKPDKLTEMDALIAYLQSLK